MNLFVSGIFLALALLVPPAALSETPAYCNPWYPTPQGARWEYEETSGAGRSRAVRSVVVDRVENSAAGARAVLRQTIREASKQSLARAAGVTDLVCKNGDIELTTRGAAQGRSRNAEADGRVVATVPGLPSAEKLKVGSSWDSTSRIEADEKTRHIVIEGKRRSRVVSQGPIEVPAGTFSEALEIVTKQTLTRTDIPDGAVTNQVIREWYVRGVGLVQRETRVAGGSADTVTKETLRHFVR